MNDPDAVPTARRDRPAWRAAAPLTEADGPPARTVWRGAPPTPPSARCCRRVPEEQAKGETTYAIAYAAANHTKWFWGAYG